MEWKLNLEQDLEQKYFSAKMGFYFAPTTPPSPAPQAPFLVPSLPHWFPTWPLPCSLASWHFPGCLSLAASLAPSLSHSMAPSMGSGLPDSLPPFLSAGFSSINQCLRFLHYYYYYLYFTRYYSKKWEMPLGIPYLFFISDSLHLLWPITDFTYKLGFLEINDSFSTSSFSQTNICFFFFQYHQLIHRQHLLHGQSNLLTKVRKKPGFYTRFHC